MTGIGKMVKITTEQLIDDYANTPDGWNPMDMAPQDAKTVEVIMEDGTEYREAYWACDQSGEDQPAFKGWFIPIYSENGGKLLHYKGIPKPVGWRPIL